MNLFLVVAGTYQEYQDYKKRSQLTGHYQYVANPDMVRGLRDPHGIFIGSFRQRRDIKQIVQNLILASTSNQVLVDLMKTL